MFFKRFLVFCLCACFNLAIAKTDNSVVETTGGRVAVLGHSFDRLAPVHPEQVRLVFYSLEGLPLSGATSIFVNGVYHASLIQGAYSDLCFSPGAVQLGVQQVQVGQARSKPLDAITAIEFQGGHVYHLRVREHNGHPVLAPVSGEQAERELPSNRLQLHTLSRVAQPCKEVLSTPANEPVVLRETPAPEAAGLRDVLAERILFAYARSDRKGMRASGREALEQAMAHLKSDYSRIDRVHVIGHADPLGGKAANTRVALQRAQTVGQYIGSTLALSASVSTEGLGSLEPVVTHCSHADNAQARRCHQPNRRVVIEVTGVRR